MRDRINLHACIWSDEIHVMVPTRLMKSFTEFLVNAGAKELSFLESAVNVFRDMEKEKSDGNAGTDQRA